MPPTPTPAVESVATMRRCPTCKAGEGEAVFTTRGKLCRDYKREYDAAFRAKHTERIRARVMAHRLAHSEEIKAKRRSAYLKERAARTAHNRKTRRLALVAPGTTITRKEYSRLWYAANATRQKAYSLRQLYGITAEQYAQMLDDQKGVCAICNSNNGGKSLAVDHVHDESRRVRGLLCAKCNAGIGMFRDEPELLIKAIAYLEASS
jgi:hypothetical protein